MGIKWLKNQIIPGGAKAALGDHMSHKVLDECLVTVVNFQLPYLKPEN